MYSLVCILMLSSLRVATQTDGVSLTKKPFILSALDDDDLKKRKRTQNILICAYILAALIGLGLILLVALLVRRYAASLRLENMTQIYCY